MPPGSDTALTHWKFAFDAVTALAALVVAAGGVFALYQWNREQLWRSKEWLRQFSESFKDTPGAQNAMMMLGDSSRDVPLWDKGVPEDRYVRVSWEDVEAALVPPSLATPSQESMHTAIRDSFVDLLGRIGSLETLLKDRLVHTEDARMAINRWLQIIGSTDKDRPHIRNLRLWMEDRKMVTAQAVFGRFGVDLRADLDADRRSFQADRKQQG